MSWRVLTVLLLVFAAACKFDPIGATVTGKDAGGGRDAVVAADADVDRDGGQTDADVELDGAAPDAEPPDAGLPARTIYFPSAGGGEVGSARHRATLVVGGSAAPRTSTSATHRVQFGGGAR